ncbi:MAG: hypothetical protein K2K13_04150 [Clostridiales bacterium]|nr:hypothetical protein [Clostridiales bacterium]
MLKHTKRGIFILLVMLCITFAFAIGCGSIEMPGGPNEPGGGDRLPAVSSSSISIHKEGDSFWVSWTAVEGAQSYEVKCGSASVTTQITLVDLSTVGGFTMPEAGDKITVTITAKGDGYKNSSPTSITYEEGKQVSSPEILSFADGIITWKEDSNAKTYTVKVDGVEAAQGTSTTFNVASLSGNAKIEITASNGQSSSTIAVMYNSASRKLSVMPITDYTINGDIIRWSPIGGVVGYKVVDLDFNSYIVTTSHYIMSVRNLVYGVYPVMPVTSVVESAEITPVDIKYLDGSGTEADPYLIKTPFDLRAIDYYELKSSEIKSNAKNYYKIANDLNYSTVSALEAESNLFTLRKPFMGVLNGDGHTLSKITVNTDNGFWALFEFIAVGGMVTNIKFDEVEITNGIQKLEFPINPATAMVAYQNYGTVSSVALSNSKFTVKAGSAAGLVIHNYGTVENCMVVNCDLQEDATSAMGSAAYEMAGVVLENCKGGLVSGNTVSVLNIYGVGNKASGNIGSSAGIVAINRADGKVNNNSFDLVNIRSIKTGKEAGGVVAYCAKGSDVTAGSASLGTLTVDASQIGATTGTQAQPYGKLYGKQG